MKNYSLKSSLCAIAAVGLIAWGLSEMYKPLAPIFIGAVLLAEVMTTSRRNP